MGTWHHPCGHSVRADSHTHERTRHGLTKLLRAVKTQIGVAKKYFIKEKENMNKTYRQVRELKEELYRYDWLPQKQLDWYQNGICSLSKPARVQKVLQLFHSSLQNFTVTFEELKKLQRPENYPMSNMKTRKKVINGMAELLIQVLCEVEWALESLNLAVPERVKEDLFPKKEKWNANPDITGLLVQDWGVISLYKNFLGDWHLIIDRVSKKTACKSSGSVSRRKNKPKVRKTAKSGS
ncbi:uncharacterized protein LOC111864612 isoform X2 [Cryptotermes secundus]|nr:uncharacterized protein LOC111864612 isoform X2 [Cryptotermes secundus]